MSQLLSDTNWYLISNGQNCTSSIWSCQKLVLTQIDLYYRYKFAFPSTVSQYHYPRLIKYLIHWYKITHIVTSDQSTFL